MSIHCGVSIWTRGTAGQLADARASRFRAVKLAIEKLPLLLLSLGLMMIAQHKCFDRFDSGEPLAASWSTRLADAARGVWFFP